MRLSRKKVEFSDYSFIRLFLAFLIKNNIVKFDKNSIGYDLIDFFKDENFKELFEDLSIKEQIEGDFVDFSGCLREAVLYEIISATSIQNTNNRLIFLNKNEAENIINSYESKYINKMNQLVEGYIAKITVKEKKTLPKKEQVKAKKLIKKL